MKGLHVSRSWAGGDKERFPECPCKEAPCGLVEPDRECPQHSFEASKTLRRGHSLHECPGKPQDRS